MSNPEIPSRDESGGDAPRERAAHARLAADQPRLPRPREALVREAELDDEHALFWTFLYYAGCEGDSWDYLTDRPGRATRRHRRPPGLIDGVEHGGALLDAIDDYLDRRPPEATARALQRVLRGVSQTQPIAGLPTALDEPGDPTGTTPGTAP